MCSGATPGVAVKVAPPRPIPGPAFAGEAAWGLPWPELWGSSASRGRGQARWWVVPLKAGVCVLAARLRLGLLLVLQP